MKRVFLGLGSNLGDRQANLRDAIKMTGKDLGKVMKSSSVYETQPWGFDSENNFLNMVILINTVHAPAGLIKKVLMVESALGRVRNSTGYSSRVIDIDILFYEDRVISDPGLTIPHPLIQERRFVLVPLCELAPDLIHPVFGKSISELLGVCPDKSKISRFNITF